MRTLAAVEPQGLGVVDHDGKDRDFAFILASGNGHKRREDTGFGRVDLVERLAGVIKVGLRHGVVAVEELELHHGAGLGGDLLRPVLEASLVVDGVATNRYDLDFDGCCC